VTPILYQGAIISIGETRSSAYVIGLPSGARAGGPWRVAEGVRVPGAGEAVIDRGVAEKAGIGLGDTVRIIGRDFKIAGLSEGTAGLGLFRCLHLYGRFRTAPGKHADGKLRAGDGQPG